MPVHDKYLLDRNQPGHQPACRVDDIDTQAWPSSTFKLANSLIIKPLDCGI